MRDSFISFFILKSVTAVRSINFIIFIRSKSDNRFISITYRLEYKFSSKAAGSSNDAKVVYKSEGVVNR